jgi:hypothetical protein
MPRCKGVRQMPGDDRSDGPSPRADIARATERMYEDERLAGGSGLTDRGRGEILQAVERLAKARAGRMSDTDALARSMRRLAGASIRASETGNARLLLGAGSDSLVSAAESSLVVASLKLGRDPDENALSVSTALLALSKDPIRQQNLADALSQTESGE